eukprot:TRINITY_DN1843_c0_g1_i1.p1 TRINITY_DN1843_c0_g1~~TRINITY_DN1843_c0_g1_i1.p1  ORF type:complete len:123 (-),score=30.70 TRINITY_DN1843_c0_g1_i1:30-398(-)
MRVCVCVCVTVLRYGVCCFACMLVPACARACVWLFMCLISLLCVQEDDLIADLDAAQTHTPPTPLKHLQQTPKKVVTSPTKLAVALEEDDDADDVCKPLFDDEQPDRLSASQERKRRLEQLR